MNVDVFFHNTAKVKRSGRFFFLIGSLWGDKQQQHMSLPPLPPLIHLDVKAYGLFDI